MSAAPEFIAPGERSFVPDHPFVDADRLFIFRRHWKDLNPMASRVHQAIQSIEAQQDDFDRLGLPGEIVLLDTHQDPQIMAAEYRKYHITDDDAVVEIGGDGIVSNGNMASYLAGYRGTKMHIGRGNACDLAHMLFKNRDMTDSVGAMTRSTLAKLYPVEATFEEPGKSALTTVYGQGYLSLGKLLKKVSEAVAAPETRSVTEGMGKNKRLAYETKLTLGEIATTNEVMIVEDSRGKHRLSDIVFPNGKRMAKTIRFGSVDLLEPGFGSLPLKHSTKRSVAWTFLRAASGSLKHYDGGETYEFDVSTESGEDVSGQRDGEPFTIKSGSRVKIRVSEHYTNQATTRRIAA